MNQDVDLHMGRRLRRRRLLLGLTQQQLASVTGVRFQQVQKYECAANKMSAVRLWSLAQALDVPITYFYDGLTDDTITSGDSTSELKGPDILASPETTELVEAYYKLDERPRKHLLEFAKAINADAPPNT